MKNAPAGAFFYLQDYAGLFRITYFYRILTLIIRAIVKIY